MLDPRAAEKQVHPLGTSFKYFSFLICVYTCVHACMHGYMGVCV